MRRPCFAILGLVLVWGWADVSARANEPAAALMIDQLRKQLSGDDPRPLSGGQAAALAAVAAKSPAYAKATAHEPHFGDDSLWGPYDVARSRYAAEKWPKARLLIFRHTSGGPHRLSRASNWTDVATGKPATKPPDAETDVVLPDSDEGYILAREVVRFRHVTWGRGTSIERRRTGTDYIIHGNLWVKAGGNFFHHMRKHFAGGRHTFCRNDNTGGAGAQYVIVEKMGDGSVEFVGQFHAGDSLRQNGGTIIVAPWSALGLGARNVFRLPKGLAIEMHDGSYLGKRNAQQYTEQEMVLDGVLRAGTDKRPLAAPCYLGFTQHNYSPFEDKPYIYGLTLGATGRVEVTRAGDDEPAELVIGQHFRKTHRSTTGFKAKLHAMDAQAPQTKKIAIAAHRGAVMLGPIVIHDVGEKLLFLEDRATFASWKDIEWGARSAPADKAIRGLTDYLRKKK